MDIGRCKFVLRLPFVFAADGDTGDLPEVVVGILSGAVDHQIRLLVDEILSLVLTHLRIRSQLNGVSRTSLFAVTAKDAPRKVDTEELRISSSMLIFRRLKRDTGDRTCHS